MQRLAILWLALGGACGGGDSELDPNVVTNLPPGDGIGTAATGTYRFESITRACGGTCATTIDGVTYSACDVGTRLDETAAVTQTEGALRFDVGHSDYVSLLEGGIDRDGTFDVGGLRTQEGGEIVITARSTGTLAGSTMTATARLAVTGQGLDCLIEADADGTRTAE